MIERFDLKQLRRELWKVAEREARKKPSIAKRRLKKNLREQMFGSGLLAKALPSNMINAINAVIDEVAEVVIKVAEFSIRAQAPSKKRLPGRPKKKIARKKAVRRQRRRGRPLADIIEEVMRNNKGKSMKVSKIRDILLEKKVRGKAKNLYPIVTTAMNKSTKFQKAGPGEYKLAK